MNTIEQEVVLLKAVIDAIDGFVNRQVFEVYGQSPEANTLFHDSIHQKFFYVLLTDFLSRIDKRAPIKPTSYLAGLREVTAAAIQHRQFGALTSACYQHVLKMAGPKRIRRYLDAIN
jgi:hypothetical protein